MIKLPKRDLIFISKFIIFLLKFLVVIMKRFRRIIGTVIIAIAILFIIIYSFIIVSDGKVTRDLLGFIIPQPPVWTSFVPGLGGFIGYIFQFFSIHGLVGVIITIGLLLLGIKIADFDK